jgi:hemerythrin-like domain-containing protein
VAAAPSGCSANGTEFRMDKGPSFLSLLDLHRELDEVFFRHQEALLLCEIDRAIDELKIYERTLLIHMQDEEELLLPIYTARTDKIPGGSLELFIAEHKKMKKFLAEFSETLPQMRAKDPSELRRSIIALLDRQFMYKHLSEHHDLRERNVLYPWLDRVTSEEERRALLAKCLGEHSS